MEKPVSLLALSVQVRSTRLVAVAWTTAVSIEAALGAAVATSRIMGRMKSFSSWPRMWQCHTYSQPKSVAALLMMMGLPSAGLVTLRLALAGWMTFSDRLLLVSLKGSRGEMGRKATTMSSSGFIWTVSRQPYSLAAGILIMPSQPTRFMICTSKRWKCTGWVSTPLWVIFQNWVVPSTRFSVTGSA